MIYADTDFFLALLKEDDWLGKEAKRLLKQHGGEIWTSPAALAELLILADRFSFDPEQLIIDVLNIADLRHGEPRVFHTAASYMKYDRVGPFDPLHAAFCGNSKIISSDKAFDRLGLERIPLEGGRQAA